MKAAEGIASGLNVDERPGNWGKHKVFCPDGRKIAPSPPLFVPWAWVGVPFIALGVGPSVRSGTGSLVNTRTMLTNAHVYHGDYEKKGTWLDPDLSRSYFAPGWYQGNSPFGEHYFEGVWIPATYFLQPWRAAYDLAAVELKTAPPVQGHFDMRRILPHDAGKKYYMIGYPYKATCAGGFSECGPLDSTHGTCDEMPWSQSGELMTARRCSRASIRT